MYLLTSIPPLMSRKSVDGKEIGALYLKACVDSWIRAGFKPVSINSKEEAGRVPILDGVDYRYVERNGFDLVGKPLVYLSDLMGVGRSSGVGGFVLANADIYLKDGFKADFQRLISEAGSQTVLAFHRRDCEWHVEEASFSLSDCDCYYSGLDLFFLPDSFCAPHEDDFIFGAPWWDHYIPRFCNLSDFQIEVYRGDFVSHLVHEDRWNVRVWQTMGVNFLRAFSDLKEMAISRGKRVDFDEKFLGRFFWGLFATLLVGLLKGEIRSEYFSRKLHEVSKNNLRLISSYLK